MLEEQRMIEVIRLRREVRFQQELVDGYAQSVSIEHRDELQDLLAETKSALGDKHADFNRFVRELTMYLGLHAGASTDEVIRTVKNLAGRKDGEA